MGYLNSGFWHLRWVACFVLWGVFAWLIRKKSAEQDVMARPFRYNRKWQLCSPTLTIGAVD